MNLNTSFIVFNTVICIKICNFLFYSVNWEDYLLDKVYLGIRVHIFGIKICAP